MFNFLKEKLKGWIGKLNKEEKSKVKTAKKQKKEIKKEQRRKEDLKEIGKSILKDIKKDEAQGRARIKKQYEAEEICLEKQEIQKEPHPGFLSKLFSRKQEEKASSQKKGFFEFFRAKIDKAKFEEIFSDLEFALLQNNVAVSAVEEIKNHLENELLDKSLAEISIKLSLKKAITSILIDPPNFIKSIKNSLKNKKPYVIIFVGINGSGKTTTIAKIANLLKKENLSVCLGAADTFRAASIEQLEQHANKLNLPIVKKDYGADPASVGFDAIAYARKHSIDVVLIDTAGRMNTKEGLIKEMEKIVRVNQPDLKLFIGESITGNDATEQAKTFNEAINLDGIILSKADVDEKGGAAISISKVTGKPIFFLGTGQKYQDLEVFNKKKIINQLGLD